MWGLTQSNASTSKMLHSSPPPPPQKKIPSRDFMTQFPPLHVLSLQHHLLINLFNIIMLYQKLPNSFNSVEILPIRVAKQSWPSSLSTSVEIKSVLMFFCLSLYPKRFAPLAAWSPGLTFLNFKNGWNTSMCSSSTSTISDLSSADYPLKKWNTPIPLFPQKWLPFSGTTQNFNILLTKFPNSIEIKFVLCLIPFRVALCAIGCPASGPLATNKYA